MSTDLEIESTFIPHLRTQFSRGNVVLFTGAGFSWDARNMGGEQIPTAPHLTKLLWELCWGADPFDPTTQLQDIYDAALQSNRGATAKLMRDKFNVDSDRSGDYYSRLLSMPWHRIYTLNIDNLIDKTLDTHGAARPVRCISATSGRIADVADDCLAVIHLNGLLNDAPDNVTFGRGQYALRGPADPFYELLKHDLYSRPVVFMGSSLEEGSLWQNLAMRGPAKRRDERELRHRSYLVASQLNKSKQALLSQYKVEWLQMTTEQFCNRIVDSLDAAKVEGNKCLRAKRDGLDTSAPRYLRMSDLPPSSREPSEYLLGAEPTWSDVTLGRVANRPCFTEILALMSEARAATSIKKFFIVTGTAGTGKSSAMMATALRLEADGVPCVWIDGSDRFDIARMRAVIANDKGLGALFIADADLLERRISRLVRDLSESNPRLITVCECRATKVDRIIDRSELRDISVVEYTVPYLSDADIDSILAVLETENRLGTLKGQSNEQRRQVFRAESGRQLLVAMYKATHGEEFQKRAISEWSELDPTQKYLYAIIAVAHSHRFYVTKDELAMACGDDVEHWPRGLDALVRRKVILLGAEDTFRARHREIAQFVYDDVTQSGAVKDAIGALIKIAGTKSSIGSDRGARPSRMLATFVNHNLIKRTLGVAHGRALYAEFEPLLEWDHHYWLHRGAMELESDNLPLAETFLHNAKGIEPNDVFIDNELAYLALRKANASPKDAGSSDLVKEGMRCLAAVALRRPDQRARAFHIMGCQGLIWANQSSMDAMEKRAFLQGLRKDVQSALGDDTDKLLSNLDAELHREILRLAVPKDLTH